MYGRKSDSNSRTSSEKMILISSFLEYFLKTKIRIVRMEIVLHNLVVMMLNSKVYFGLNEITVNLC